MIHGERTAAPDRIRREQMDGIAAHAKPPEWNRARLHDGRSLPSRIRSRSAYTGRMEGRTARARTYIREAGRSTPELEFDGLSMARLLFRQSLFNYYERFGYFVPEFGEVCGQQGPLGIDHNVRSQFTMQPMQADGLAQPPLHPVALNSAAERLPNGETHAQTLAFQRRSNSGHVEHRHVRGEVPPSLLVNPFKVGVPQQAPGFRKAVPGLRILFRHIGLQFRVRHVRKTCTGPQLDSWRLTLEAVLLAKSGLNGNSFAPLGAPAGNDRASALGLHTGTEAVRLRAAATVRLECAFRHEKSCAPVFSNYDWVKRKYK